MSNSRVNFVIHTERLELVPSTLAHIEAELETPCRFGDLLGVPIPESWPPGEYDRDALEYFRAKLESGGPSHVGWYGWYALTRNPSEQCKLLIACAGFLGPPSDGTVEIGYSVIPSARNQGYASEIVSALLARAFSDSSVTEVIAHTSDLNVPSIKVLLRCGFHLVGPGIEPDSVQYKVTRPPRA